MPIRPRHFYILPLLVSLTVVTTHEAIPAAGFSLYAQSLLDENHRPVVKVSTNIPYSGLIFLRKNGKFTANYDLYIRILDEKKKEVIDTAVVGKQVVAENYEETKSNKAVSSVSERFNLQPGATYHVECTLRVEDTHLSYQKEATVTVTDLLQGGIGVSTPRLFATAIPTSERVLTLRRSTITNQAGDVEQENPTFTDVNRQPALKFEVYLEGAGRDSVPCVISYEVINPEKVQVLYGRRPVKLSGKQDQFVVTFDVDDWKPDKYVFNVKAAVKKPEKATSTNLTFSLEFTRLMLTEEFDKTIDILALIGTEDEIKELREAPESRRAELWTAFWVRRDPTPDTRDNEALEEHLRRVRYVDVNFSQVGPGWKSDRGKVYIVHGEPDQIDVQMDPYLQGEYITWRYYEKNLEFVFYDRFGLGEYRLSSFRTF